MAALWILSPLGFHGDSRPQRAYDVPFQSQLGWEVQQLRARVAWVAEVAILTWNYKTQDDSIRHIGPMAQDFRAAFGLGEDDKRITTIDADGVALAAIQALYKLVDGEDAGRGVGAKALRALGIAVEDAAGNFRGAHEVMLDLADVFRELPDGPEKSRLAIEVFGRSGVALIPTLNKGREGLRALVPELDDLAPASARPPAASRRPSARRRAASRARYATR